MAQHSHTWRRDFITDILIGVTTKFHHREHEDHEDFDWRDEETSSRRTRIFLGIDMALKRLNNKIGGLPEIEIEQQKRTQITRGSLQNTGRGVKCERIDLKAPDPKIKTKE